MRPHSTFAEFNGAKDDTFPIVLHEIVKGDKGKKLALRGLRPLPPIDAKDVEVSPLHMIFDLKGSLLGRNILELITSYLHHLTQLEVAPYSIRVLYPGQF
jgi:hypothetical protein